MRAVFRLQFWQDLEDGICYLAEHASPGTAEEWHESVFTSVKLVCEHPHAGRRRKDLLPEAIRTFRVKAFPKYFIFYSVGASVVEVLRFKHGMMNLPGLFALLPKQGLDKGPG